MIKCGTQQVRLSDQERKQILEAVEEVSASMSVVWSRIALFGSRTDVSGRGGDIDLYLSVAKPPADRFAFRTKLKILLKEMLGDQKFDLIIDDGATDSGAFLEIAKKQSVDLWIRQ